jgi:2-polyprenyl-3-methyl-5-hydroxy-6-metoxy-1,4-benzoquinol methylase
MSTTPLPQASADAPCAVCGTGMALRPVGDSKLFVCPSCGLGRVPDVGTRPDFWEAGAEDELEHKYWTEARADMFEKALIHLESYGSPGRLIDVGGGVGHFAERALARGWDAFSVEISEPARQVAAGRLGSERSLAPEQVRERPGTFDVVTLWCVIAHVLDPVDLVRSAVDLVAPGGRILLTTPNFIFQGAAARALARLGHPYDLISRDHVLHFTPSALRKLLAAAGVESPRFVYVGSSDYCFISPRFATVLIPAKKVWNRIGAHAGVAGLPPLSSELQVIGRKAPTPATKD